MENENSFTTKEFTGEIPTESLDIKSLGEGFEIVSSKKILFNHELANKYLQMTNCPWERNLKNHHVSFLAGQMRGGTFLPELVKLASCICEENGIEYRINGQHSNWSRLEISEEEWKPELVECLKYKAKTLNDVRRLYALIDRGSPRTRANVINSYLNGIEQFANTTPTMIRTIAEGFSFWMWESTHERSAHTGDDVAYLLQTEYYDVTCKVLTFCETEPKFLNFGFMRKSSVMAAIFETFSKVQKDAEDFWQAIKTGIGMNSADDPRLKLRNTLMITNTQKDNTRGSGKKIASSETLYRWSISAFNSWRDGLLIKNLRVTNKRIRAK